MKERQVRAQHILQRATPKGCYLLPIQVLPIQGTTCGITPTGCYPCRVLPPDGGVDAEEDGVEEHRGREGWECLIPDP